MSAAHAAVSGPPSFRLEVGGGPPRVDIPVGAAGAGAAGGLESPPVRSGSTGGGPAGEQAQCARAAGGSSPLDAVRATAPGARGARDTLEPPKGVAAGKGWLVGSQLGGAASH